MSEDIYKTIAGPAFGEFKDKGSKFIAYASPVYDEDAAKEAIDFMRKEHPKARHHCFAYRIGPDNLLFRANDAGEPSGTAGKPILGQIDSAGLTNIVIVVSRYFGGTLLGVAGLINAYRSAAANAIENADFIEKTVDDHFRIEFTYEEMNEVMNYIKKENLNVINQKFEVTCMIEISIRKRNSDAVMEDLQKINNLTITHLYTR